MNNLQTIIDTCIANGVAQVYVILGFLVAILTEGIVSIVNLYYERFKERNNHPKKLIIMVDLGKLPNNVYKYHQLLRKRSHDDWEHHIYTSLEDLFITTHTDKDLEEISKLK